MTANPWDQRPDETSSAYELFAVYLNEGPLAAADPSGRPSPAPGRSRHRCPPGSGPLRLVAKPRPSVPKQNCVQLRQGSAQGAGGHHVGASGLQQLGG